MKTKILNLVVLISSLFGYLEWGVDSSSFLFQNEIEVLRQMLKDPLSIIHPFTLLPVAGQLMLLVAAFKKGTSKLLSYLGTGFLAVLLLFILFIGLMEMNIKTIASIIPFLISSIMLILHLRKQ